MSGKFKHIADMVRQKRDQITRERDNANDRAEDRRGNNKVPGHVEGGTPEGLPSKPHDRDM